MAAGRSGAHATEGTAPFMARLLAIGIAEPSLPQGLPASILAAGSHGARETDYGAASCEGSRRSAGAMRCPH
jgi:hypothetical protein